MVLCSGAGMKRSDVCTGGAHGLREMVKTIVLRQDPPFCKKTGGLFMYPASPTLKDGVLFV